VRQNWRICTVKRVRVGATLTPMSDPQLIRRTFDTIDDLVDRIRRGTTPYATVASPAPTRLVIDEGRAAAEWTLDLDVDGHVHPVGLLVVCEVAADRLVDARLYVAPPQRADAELGTENATSPAPIGSHNITPDTGGTH